MVSDLEGERSVTMIIWGPMSWMDKASCIIVEKLMWWMLIKIALKVVVKVYFDMQMDKSISYVHNYPISFEKMYTVSIKVKLPESLISKCISYSFVGSAILGRPERTRPRPPYLFGFYSATCIFGNGIMSWNN